MSFKDLLQKYLTDELSDQEISDFFRLLQQPENQRFLDEEIGGVWREEGIISPSNELLTERALNQLRVALKREDSYASKTRPPVRRVHFLPRRLFRYAAAIFIAVGLGTVTYLWVINQDTPQTLANADKQLQTDIPPGGHRAILTLGDGSEIALDSAAIGTLARQKGVQVVKLANGQIAYDIRRLSGPEVMWNTMTTPKGGQYQVTLPDGTKVWLNAASSIKFPTAFVGKDRKVQINGEVYFEVAQDRQKPFLVDIYGESLIEVLGTSFSVNAYQNENVMRTTLIEGSVRVSKGQESRILEPGQQAVTSASRGEFKIEDVDIDRAIAWKNGFFNFEDLDTYAVVRQLERWYDINVRYEEPIHNVIFQGQIVRDTNLSDVIELLQKGGVRCRLEGKTMVVF